MAMGAACGVPPLAAQTATVAGRVLHPGPSDTTTVARLRVVLHRVAADSQGPIDSVRSDSTGNFRLAFRPDTGAIYLLSARYDGIEYFSNAVRVRPGQPDTGARLFVYDTSSTAPIAVAARHIVLPRAGQDGSRTAIDLIVLENAGRVARVAPDSLHPSWSMALPSGISDLVVGESDLSSEAVVRVEDSIHVIAPLAPGQKQLTLEYVVPAGAREVAWTMGASDVPLNLLLEDRGLRLSGAPLAPVDSQMIQGRLFHRYRGTVPAHGVVRLRLGGSPRAPWPVLAALVAAVALALGFGGWRLLRRTAPHPGVHPNHLLDAIAALDARYAGRNEDTPTEEWEAYRSERERLKAQLERALAGGDAHR